jgi:hypothetical protein
MSKLLFISLVAISSTLAILPKARALQPRDDLYVHVVNSTSHTLEICNSELTFCKGVPPGQTFSDAQATKNEAADYFVFWLSHSAVKICGKVIPLKEMITDQVEDKGWWGKLTYRLTVREESYLRECSAAAIKK